MPTITCNFKGCDQPATHHLELWAWPKGAPKSQVDPLEMTVGLNLCQRHASMSTIDDVITDEGWAIISFNVTARGYAEPDRTTLQLIVKPGLASKVVKVN